MAVKEKFRVRTIWNFDMYPAYMYTYIQSDSEFSWILNIKFKMKKMNNDVKKKWNHFLYACPYAGLSAKLIFLRNGCTDESVETG